MRRFYAPVDCFSGGQVTLDNEETRHLRDVLRLRSGDDISVFDGTGREYLCHILEVGKKATLAAVINTISPASSESPFELTLAAAILKGDKFDLVIQKAVELGVARFIPLQTARCEVRSVDKKKRLERWRRICLEATKQSGRASLMEISEVRNVGGILASLDPKHTVLFSERDGTALSNVSPVDSLTAVFGPEGGWDDSEIKAAVSAGIPVITLGGRILRAETAAIAVSAVLQNRFGDLN